MTGGYMGKMLFVDLTRGELKDEVLDDKLCRQFIGGYGIGARLLYSRQKAGVDPLGPENIFGILTGPLTGTPVPSGCRYTAVAKSPITGGWGDANSGGDFAPHLKFAGYDAVFFTGISEKPVYLLIDNGKASLKDAGTLWGKDSYETEDTLKLNSVRTPNLFASVPRARISRLFPASSVTGALRRPAPALAL